MKKYIFSGLLLMASMNAFAQMQVDNRIELTGSAANKRVTGLSNASAVTPLASDAVNIATFQSNYTNYGAGTFATGTYTVALIPATTVYWDGMIVSFRASAINTGVTNLNVNGLGVQAIVKAGGQALVAGDIKANQMVTVVYNLGSTRFEIIGSVGNGAGWSTLGNAGTTPATNFVGTTDAQDLVFRANNTERMRISSAGEIVVGSTTPFTGDIFSSYAGATQIGIAGYGTTGTGIYGQATGANGFGVRGITNQATGLGVFGVNLATGGVGVQGQANTGAAVGVFGTTTSATNFATGVYGQATATTTQTRGVYGIASSSNGTGVVGVNNNPASANSGIGIMGAGNNSPLYILPVGGGIYGNGIPYGVVGLGNRAADGWGVVAAGNDLGTFTITGGGGGAFNGVQWGVLGSATTTTNATDRAAFVGNFNSTGTTGSTVYVGARIGGVVYKILGAGGASVSTTMQTREGERILFAPESPENWFFDIGEVQLVNGKAKIQLDPLFYDCISHEKPFKIFVQGAENTLGAIRIKARGNDWFELEDTGGASNGTVMFNIYAIWKGKENLRLPKFENPAKVIYQEKIKVADGNYQTKPSVQAQDIKK